MAIIEHGLYKGYLKCRYLPGGACPVCKEARNLYMSEWRKKQPEKFRANVESSQLRDKAMRILARKHSAELQRIIKFLKEDDG